VNMKSTADIVITAPSSEFKPPARIRHNPAKKTKEPADFLGLDGLLIKTEMLRDPDWMANRKLFARTDQQSPDDWLATVFRELNNHHRADPWVLYINGIYLVGARPFNKSDVISEFAKKVVTDATMTHSNVIVTSVVANPNHNDMPSRACRAILKACNCVSVDAMVAVIQ